MMMFVSKRLTLRGFIVTDHGDAAVGVLPPRRRPGSPTAR